MNIVVYGKPECLWCNTLKKYTEEKRIKIDYRDVSGWKKEDISELVHNANGYRKLPMVFVDGEFIGGYEEFKEMFDDEL